MHKGVFPDPPTVMPPITTTGTSGAVDFKTSVPYKKRLAAVANLKTQEKGISGKRIKKDVAPFSYQILSITDNFSCFSFYTEFFSL